MKIELKGINYSERLSEETNAFTANLYIDGKRAGTVSNWGQGGPTDYRADTAEGRDLITKAEAYCKSLPGEKFTSGGKEYTLDMDLQLYIDNLLGNYLNEKEIQKFQKKIDKAMVNSIVVGIPNHAYRERKFNFTIERLIAYPTGHDLLARALEQIKPYLVDGNMIMNTNIPERFFKEAGLNENQYFPLALAKKEGQKNKKLNKKGRSQ